MTLGPTNMSKTGELGRYAYEERMPGWLEKLLRKDAVNGGDGELAMPLAPLSRQHINPFSQQGAWRH